MLACLSEEKTKSFSQRQMSEETFQNLRNPAKNFKLKSIMAFTKKSERRRQAITSGP